MLIYIYMCIYIYTYILVLEMHKAMAGLKRYNLLGHFSTSKLD